MYLPLFVRQITQLNWSMSYILGSLDSEGLYFALTIFSLGNMSPLPPCLPARLSRGIPNAIPSVQPSLQLSNS